MTPICPICETAHEKHQAHVFRPRQGVTKVAWFCNHCVTKDEEIARLRNQLEELRRGIERKALSGTVNGQKPKRDRAAYMREYRAEKRA